MIIVVSDLDEMYCIYSEGFLPHRTMGKVFQGHLNLFIWTTLHWPIS